MTGRISSALPSGHAYSRTEWWAHVLAIPAPRIVVFEDVDDPPGRGAFWGEVQANIHIALGCVGVLTNGSVRDVPEILKLPFSYFAGSLSVSHAYASLIDFGTPVTVDGLTVQEGDLLHGDVHGVLQIPNGRAAELPTLADRLLERERAIISFCRSDSFSVDGLSDLMK